MLTTKFVMGSVGPCTGLKIHFTMVLCILSCITPYQNRSSCAFTRKSVSSINPRNNLKVLFLLLCIFEKLPQKLFRVSLSENIVGEVTYNFYA